MMELAKHVASWTSGFNPIIPEIMLMLKATGYSQNYAGIIAAPLKRAQGFGLV